MEQIKDIDLFKEAFKEVMDSNNSGIRIGDYDFPDFVTVENFGQVHFFNGSRLKTKNLSDKLHKTIDSEERTIELREYLKIIRQEIANLYVENIEATSDLDYPALFRKFKENIRKSIENLKIEITHHFACTTVGFEKETPFKIGPVTFIEKKQWIENSEFQSRDKNNYSQEEIRSFLLEPNDENFEKLDFSLQAISSKFKYTRTIASTIMIGREFNLSKKVARITTKSALDALSLLLGQQVFFLQNRLTEELKINGMVNSVSTRMGITFLSGSMATNAIPIHSPKIINEFISKSKSEVDAIDFIISNFSMDKKGKYPNLCQRWVSALDWFAEGCRDENDSIALAKMSLALDVLSASGNSRGTLDTISNLLGLKKNEIADKNRGITLEDLFASFYKEGRSKIVHGEIADRFQTFEDLKKRIFFFTRLVLMKAALALHAHEGEDKKDAFRTMKPV